MNHRFKHSLLLASLALLPGLGNASEEVLYSKLVQPILNAKCVSCHGTEKQKGKLRLDSFAEVMKGSDGENVVPGKPDESYLIERIALPLDDDDHMPPEDEPQLTKEEAAVLKFWVQSGAKEKAKIAELKPAGEFDAAIKVVLANPPKAAAGAAPAAAPVKIDPAKQKLAEETIKKVEAAGASLMAIAQDTPDLRFSALNVAKEYGDKNLELLKPVADQVKWMDLARTQVTDGGLANLAGMKNLARLHLENTKITDAGLDHLKALANLEYLNLYGTTVTDAGIAKLSGLKKLKKLFVWQTKVTDAGAKKLVAAVPGLYVNTGWKEPAKPAATVAAATPPKTTPKPATPKPATPKPTPPKPTPPKPATPKPPPPKPAPKPATPAPKPVAPTPATNAQTIASLGATIDKALADAKAASEAAKNTAVAANKTAGEAKTIAAAAKKAGEDSSKAAAESAKVASEAKTTAEASRKVAAEAKAAADAAKKAAADAQTAAAAAQKAAQAANAVATQAKTALEQLQKAAAAIAGAGAAAKK